MSRRPTPDCGLDLIKHFEGWSATPYMCPAAHPTIAWGAIWGRDGKRVTMSHPAVTKEQGTDLLKRDLNICERSVIQLINTELSDEQYAALVSFCFNLGSGSLECSTLRKKLNRGDYDGAAREFGRWVFAGGKRLRGLVLRRRAEMELFLE